MIRVTLQQLLSAFESLNEISSRILNIQASFLIARLINEIEVEYKLFQKQRAILIDKYAARDENNKIQQDEKNNIILRLDTAEEFNKEINELLKTEVELNCAQIPLNTLSDLMVSPKLIKDLLPFIKEKDPTQ